MSDPRAAHRSAIDFPPPVWLSSIEHLQQLTRIYRSNSILRRIVGLCTIPEGFPYLWYWLTPFVRVPIIYFANGRLILVPQGLRFESVRRTLFAASVANVRENFRLEVRREDILSIEAFSLDSAELPIRSLSYFNIPWTRIRTRLPGEAGDFLIGLGGTGPSMAGIRRRNRQLLETLNRLYSC